MIGSSARRRMAISMRLVLAWRPTGAKLVGLLRSMITSFIALGVTLYILPGRQSSGPGAVVLLVITVAAVGVLLRPLLLGLAVLLGSFGLLVVGVLAQALILEVAVSLAPDVHIPRFSVILGASWLAASIAALVNWLLDAGNQDAYLAQVLGRVVRIAHRHARDGTAAVGEPGMLIVQLDGVGQGLLRQAVVAGAVPTLASWLRSGSHRSYQWHTGVPATTPAGQAVLLHGDARCVPSFRWLEKDTGRTVVANHAGDAQLIERRISTGRGLLADDGVSVSNLFSGDAPIRILTMSDARLPSRSTRGLASFATTSLGFVRTLVVFVGQVLQERYQARRQRRRGVSPRVERSRLFALLRGVTTALLHDLNVAIVAEQMARGAPVVFVDFVDYDELAHHAGPTRPESMRALDGLDRVLSFFADVAAETNRRYEIVVVSDHGQAQGEPFAQLAGMTLQQLVDSLTAGGQPGAEQADAPVEQWSAANLLLTSAARSQKYGVDRLARRRADDPSRPAPDELEVSLGHSGRQPTLATPVVLASGSLAHIYLPDVSGRATREQIEERYPELIAGLAGQHGIGVILVSSEAHRPVVIGPTGWRSLAGPGGAGDDPLQAYGGMAAADLVQLDTRDHVGDLVVLGRYDPYSGEVAAFEELVGSHGGLGGDQTEAVLLVPNAWPRLAPDDRIDARGVRTPPVLLGPDVHRAFLDRLRELGLRPGDGAPDQVPAPPTERLDVRS